MKPITTFAVLATLAFIALAIMSGIQAWCNHRDVQPLVLADDASTPAQKAEYLRAFASDVEKANLPEYGAFVFKHERNRVANQRKVLDSLIRRCDDLSKVDPKELGYATGMQQITGQEFDHTLAEIRDIYKGAMWVKAGWFVTYGWLISMLVAGTLWAGAAVSSY